MSTKASKTDSAVEKKITRSGVKRKAAEKHSTATSVDVEEEDFQEETSAKTKKKATKRKTVKVEESEQEIKKETKSQTKKRATAKAAVEKPQLQIPDIKVPVKGEIIERPKGPSPWGNGTIKFTDKIYPGAHVSAAGGLENAVFNAVEIGASSFALFLKSQRQWVAKPMEESTVTKFKEACEKHGISPHLILPHGSYLMNLGSTDETTLSKSRAVLLDEVQRCDRLGLLYYNIHPGSTCGKGTREESIQRIADSINWVHQETLGSKVAVVLENMCRQGNTIGGDLSDLADIIRLVFDRSRVGVCVDTCHALAAGYDVATPKGFQSFLDDFDRIIGLHYLVAVHLNDSKGPLGCHADRHESIGSGFIGKVDGFRHIMNCKQFRDIPLILETPYISDDTYRREIILLKSLVDKNDSESP